MTIWPFTLNLFQDMKKRKAIKKEIMDWRPTVNTYSCQVHFIDGTVINRQCYGFNFISAADTLRNTGFDVNGVYYPGQAIVKITEVKQNG